MIRFDNWTIQADGEILARQFDNKTRTLTVAGDIPVGWEWVVLVQVGNAMDIIPLTVAEGVLSAVLTARQLSIAGYYQMQLRATQEDKVLHTNTVSVYIPASLSGDEQWPTVPSEFTEMEQRIKGYAEHPPVVGENGNWWEWNGTAYVDTGKTSRGQEVQSVAFDSQRGRWVSTYTDGTTTSIDGYDPADSAVWSFMRDDFERYAVEDNNFMEQAISDWKNHDFRPIENTRHSVVEDGGNKYLSMQCMTGDAIASLVLDHPIQGEHTIEFDYMPTHPGGEKAHTDYFDVRMYTSGELAVNARVNYMGVSCIYTVLSGKSQRSNTIMDANGKCFTYDPGVWYRIKVIVRVGEITMKVWKRDSESEPVGKSGPGVESLALDLLTPEFVAAPYELMFYLWDFGEEPPTDNGWQVYLDNVKVYRDTSDGIVEKVLAALPVYNGEVENV